MASLTPGGAIVSFGGVGITAAGIGFGALTSQSVKALEPIIGQLNPVDLYNSQPAPRTTTYMPEVLLRADDTITDPILAWTALINAYRDLDGLPETGTLVVNKTAGGGGTVSCQARRDPLNLALTPRNARHIIVPMVFTLLSPWV